jgi:hypothetical protein
MPEHELDPTLRAAAAKADALRAASLTGLAGVIEARQVALERERGRLAQTLGTEHSRVQALGRRLENGATRLRDLGVEVARAKTVVPEVSETEWAIHGHVRRADRTPAPDVTVLLVDSAGQWQRSLGYACSDAAGYFRLVSRVERPRPEPSAGAVYLRVIGPDRTELHRGDEPLTVTPGVVEYREIVLHDANRRCASPDEDLPVGPGTAAPSEEPPPARGKKSRRKG